ncbi:BQ5605_C004g03015 [Microbotryum silenes-dioicae]|uniref:BQ5605_C004g03015 protein n=1 Tax=Microbotryum silenes-dioicae TaxID=796604 RepID=A0A2X0PBS7_9BASI|nr:BQ5605_C004g03015 [Microbotryum silenes-dioicae]
MTKARRSIPLRGVAQAFNTIERASGRTPREVAYGMLCVSLVRPTRAIQERVEIVQRGCGELLRACVEGFWRAAGCCKVLMKDSGDY